MDVLASSLLAFSLTGIAIGLLIPRARRLGLLDIPGGHKAHAGATPMVGGLAIFVGILAGFGSLTALEVVGGWSAWGYLGGAALLILAGYLDDRRRLDTGTKALMQIAAALVLCLGTQTVIYDLGDLVGVGGLQLGWLAVPFTAFAVVGLINAMNMLDGMDGLAGSVCLAILVPLIWLAYSTNAWPVLQQLVVFAAAIIAFLCFNLQHRGRPARAFLGDTGSMLLGYTLAWFVIALSQEPLGAVRPMAVLWILVVPVSDTLRLMLLRCGQKDSPFAADNRHLHHLLARRGWSVNTIVFCATAVTLASSAFALHMQTMPGSDPILFYGFVGLFFGYVMLTHHLYRKPGRLRGSRTIQSGD